MPILACQDYNVLSQRRKQTNIRSTESQACHQDYGLPRKGTVDDDTRHDARYCIFMLSIAV